MWSCIIIAMSSYNWIDAYQLAYAPLSSTVCALIYAPDSVFKTLELPNVAAARMLAFDMSRAFDCIPHHLLLECASKLQLHDTDAFVNWLHSYLNGRQQLVQLGSIKSTLVTITLEQNWWHLHVMWPTCQATRQRMQVFMLSSTLTTLHWWLSLCIVTRVTCHL